MATTQLDGSIGAVKQSDYATPGTVSKFIEYTAASAEWDPSYIDGQGLRVGSRFDRIARASVGKQQVTADIELEAVSKGIGWLLAAALKTVVSTQRATTGVYQHNFTPVIADFLDAYTIQHGVPILGGTVAAQTMRGMVCNQLELSCATGEALMVKTNWTGKEVATDVAYVSPTYPTPMELLTFVGGSITIGGSPTAATTTALATGGTAANNIRDFTVTVASNIDDGGFNFGGAGKRVRNPALGKGEITGSVTAEFDSVTLRDAYLNQTTLNMVMTFLGTTVIGSGSDVSALQVHLPAIKLRGTLPDTSASGDVITLGVDFKAYDNLSDPTIRVSYVSTDTAP